jgi:hypothetical protein
MYIKGEEYYHLHNKNVYSDVWAVDNSLNFSNRALNSFNYYYEKYSPRINVNGMDYPPIKALEILQDGLYSRTPQYAEYLVGKFKDIITDLGLYIREELFEEVRENYFPGLPSRKTCIWVLEKKAIRYWSEILGKDFELYKLELTGIMHKADQKHLSCEIISHEEWRRRAFNYWTGVDNRNPVEEELLFEGIVKIKEKYDNIEEIAEKQT